MKFDKVKSAVVIGRKLKGGAVEFYKDGRVFAEFPSHLSNKPDYRHKYVTINCNKYCIMWDKR